MMNEEETKMMNTNMMNVNISMNMAAMLAEDTGAMELRNPRISGMKAKSLLDRFFRRKKA